MLTGIESKPELESIAPLWAANQLIDRDSIELRASQLLQERDQQPLAEVPHQEYHDNARTALMEALTASGHLSRVELSGSLQDINQQVLNRLCNGWSNSLPEHEKARRYLELCEELIIQQLHEQMVAGKLAGDLAVAVISDCPSTMLPGLGYRYDNQKGMVRSTHLQANPDGSYTRVIEQISRSNTADGSSLSFLQAHALETDHQLPADLAVMQQVFVYQQRDWLDGVVDIQRRLDTYAGGTLYGESQPNRLHVNYDELRMVSAEREQYLEGFIVRLAELEATLARHQQLGLSVAEANQIYQDEISRCLQAICLLEPDYTADTFGSAMVPHYIQAAQMFIAGEQQAALDYLESYQGLQKPITYCGVTISLKEAKEAGLPVNSLGELVEQGKESWKWKQGICQVQSCPSRPGKTEVGPCSVCRRCQAKFDAGQDPTKNKTTNQPVAKKPGKATQSSTIKALAS